MPYTNARRVPTGDQWTADLKPLRTNWEKQYLTDAPHLILVFKQQYSIKEDGTRKNHYYNELSVAIASGILITAIHVRVNSFLLLVSSHEIDVVRIDNKVVSTIGSTRNDVTFVLVDDISYFMSIVDTPLCTYSSQLSVIVH